MASLRDLINTVIDERMEIESFSPLRARFSSNSSKVPELAEESEDSDGSEEDDRICKSISDIYHDLKVNDLSRIRKYSPATLTLIYF